MSHDENRRPVEAIIAEAVDSTVEYGDGKDGARALINASKDLGKAGYMKHEIGEMDVAGMVEHTRNARHRQTSDEELPHAKP